MKTRIFSIVLLVFTISTSFGQRIVDQTEIDEQASVFLNEPMSLLAFGPALGEGETFPDFQTISIDDDVYDMNGMMQSCINNQRVPIITLGRPSCDRMRNLFKHIYLPVLEFESNNVSSYHIANSIEAHATNSYPTPYFWLDNGQPSPAPQIPELNIGFEFNQPQTGEDLIDLTVEFESKMVETGAAIEGDFDEITILLDSPEGGFTQAFSGPAIIWVVNPFTNEVVYESVDFTCAEVEGQPVNCDLEQESLVDAIRDVQELFNLVSVTQQPEMPSEQLIELPWFSVNGQNGNNGLKIFYDLQTKKKIIKPAQ